MSKKIKISLLIIGIVAILVLISSAFIVDQRKQALVLKLGKAERVINKWGEKASAGLHFRLPILEEVLYFDRRNLELDMPPREILAADQERLVVDAFVRYRIIDPLKYYRTVRDEVGAKRRLSEIVESSLRDVLGDAESHDIISVKRSDLMKSIRNLANEAAHKDNSVLIEPETGSGTKPDLKKNTKNDSGLGIEIIDVRIKRADLPEANQKRVFERMRTERKQKAALIRAEGEEKAREKKAQADRAAIGTKAQAQKEAERIQGEGDAERARVYAKAYNKDPEFYNFTRSLEAYKKSLKEGAVLVLSPDSDFFKYLKDEKGKK